MAGESRGEKGHEPAVTTGAVSASGGLSHKDHEDTAFSRPGVVGPYGPLLGELKTKVDLDLEADFRRRCNEAGTDHSSVIRNWINEFMRGVSYDDAVVHAMERRANLLPFKGPNGALGGERSQA